MSVSFRLNAPLQDYPAEGVRQVRESQPQDQPAPVRESQPQEKPSALEATRARMVALYPLLDKSITFAAQPRRSYLIKKSFDLKPRWHPKFPEGTHFLRDTLGRRIIAPVRGIRLK